MNDLKVKHLAKLKERNSKVVKILDEGMAPLVGIFWMHPKEPLINLRIMAHCGFDSRVTVWTGS
jgi:hypothetical protein